MQHPDPGDDFRTFHSRSFIGPSLPTLTVSVMVSTWITVLISAVLWPDWFTLLPRLAFVVSTILMVASLYNRYGRSAENLRSSRGVGLAAIALYSFVLTVIGSYSLVGAVYVLGAAAVVSVCLSAFTTRLRSLLMIHACTLTVPSICVAKLTGMNAELVNILMFIIGLLLCSYLLNQAFQRALFRTFVNAKESWHLARYDVLTGTETRSAWLESAETAFGTAKEFSLLFVDADRFKQVNDRFGHAAGDRVLQRIGEVLREVTPDGACVGRLGGEEFVLALPGYPHTCATVLAETIRQRVEASSVGAFAVTVSVGVATARHGESFNDVLKRADESMLHAKATGRNRVVPGDVSGAHDAGDLGATMPDPLSI